MLLQKVKEQGICISDKGPQNLPKKVRETSSVLDKLSDVLWSLSKVTLVQLSQLESIIRTDRGLIYAKLKESIGILVSTRKVRKYMRLLGCDKVLPLFIDRKIKFKDS